MTEPDLQFLIRSVDRLIGDVALMRDELTVQTAVINRLDAMVERQEATLTALIGEMRANRQQVRRLLDRLERDETRAE